MSRGCPNEPPASHRAQLGGRGEEALFAETHILSIADDDMVKQGDTYQLTSRGELVRDHIVLSTRRSIARWMIVNHNHRTCPMLNGVFKHLSRMHGRLAQPTN